MKVTLGFVMLCRLAKAVGLLTLHERDIRPPGRAKQVRRPKNLKVKQGFKVADDAQLGLVG